MTQTMNITADLTLSGIPGADAPVYGPRPGQTLELSKEEYGMLLSLSVKWFGPEAAMGRLHDGYITAVCALRACKFKGDITDRAALVGFVGGCVENRGRNTRRKLARTTPVGGESEVMDLRAYADAGRVFDNPEVRLLWAERFNRLCARLGTTPEALARLGGMDDEAAAESFGLSVGNYRQRVSRQGKTLAVYLAD